MRLLITLGVVFAVALSYLAAPVQASQEKTGTQAESDIKAVQPILPDPQKVLDQLVGNWTYTAKWWDAPQSEPMEWDGKFKAEWVLDRSFVEFKARADSNERDYEGMGFMGYDNVTGKYSHIWFDTTGTGMWISTGRYNADKNAITDTGKYSNPASGKRDWYKGVTTFSGEDVMSYEFFIKGAGGKEFRQMEILYKRVK